jgi:hypothetical protein
MFNQNKKIRELEDSIKELEFKINNPPKYKVGEVLKDGTVIISVDKIYPPSHIEWNYKYITVYKGVKNKKIINVK